MNVTHEPPGARLKRLRDGLDISMAELAVRAKVKKPSIQAYESGASPNLAAARRIARALGVTVVDIWGDDLDAGATDTSPDAGVDVRVALRTARDLGVPVESLWPEDSNDAGESAEVAP
jgi:transcriptional regulator with XRE-family HTH domain